jgi:hypothetical protein
MVSPPATGRNAQTTLREAEKQARAIESGGAVGVFGENGYFIMRLNSSRDAEKIRRLLAAPNAESVRTHGGKLVGIRLLSVGDDRGHTGERHGSSIITTERVVNDLGVYVGSHLNLKHKAENVRHARPSWTDVGTASRSGQSSAGKINRKRSQKFKSLWTGKR